MKLFSTLLLMSFSLGMNSDKDWVDSNYYPFAHHYAQLPAGNMHYIDEGQGEVILFVHGTPTWSFLYREQIKHLSKTYRCIAVDHLGFGLSDKPIDFVGTPEAHAKNLETFIDQLGLKNFTLVVHDFGGPIGLPYAIQHPENIERLVVLNTWLWETKDNKGAQKIDKILHSGMGKYLYLNRNFSPKVLLKKAYADKKKLTKEIHRHYIAPFPDKESRMGLLKIGQSLLGSSEWYGEQWKQISVLNEIPMLIVWGKQDAFISTDYLKKWTDQFPNAEVLGLDCGHFVQEEKPAILSKAIGKFMGK